VSFVEVDDEQEAIKVAGRTEYGLSSLVFTKDLARCLRIAKKIESGAVHINSMSVHDEPALPHGGVKVSGWGRFGALVLRNG
jgi:acyl-CoA reductase-like NAD-dependent aldehyde dehydrogenase